jgi:hypothetical protein
MAQVSCRASLLAPCALVNGRRSARAKRNISQQNRNRMKQHDRDAN